jgi:hypothetical protein
MALNYKDLISNTLLEINQTKKLKKNNSYRYTKTFRHQQADIL